LIRGGDNGPAVVAGKVEASLLFLAVTGKTDVVSKMPAKGEPLPAEQIELLRRWIEAGAKVSADVVEAAKTSTHWAFQRPARPPLPAVRDAAWLNNPIDAFVLARQEKESIAPSPLAERATLIRRAYLDLIGLPPSPDEVDLFIADQRPDAYERVIDRLLASPHYGERWGRHWLDVARYADSNGYTRDFGRQIWKYREWVIDAINRGQPFDQFVIEQIAGDLLESPTEDQLVAGLRAIAEMRVPVDAPPLSAQPAPRLHRRASATSDRWAAQAPPTASERRSRVRSSRRDAPGVMRPAPATLASKDRTEVCDG
jgi:hypothetical protein